MRLLKLSVPFLALLIACNSNKTTENQHTTTLDTAFLSAKKFALAYQDGEKIVATSIDTLKQISFGGATDPAISPDGNRLAYTVSDTAGHRTIWVADLDNKTQAQLPINNNNYYGAIWSPSGHAIAFNLYTKENRWKIALIKADFTGFQILDSGTEMNVFSPTWKNDKELIGHDLTNLYTFDSTGKLIDTKSIAGLIGDDHDISSSNHFFYTSDGKKLVFNAGNADVVENAVGPNEAVYVMDLATKKIDRISPEGFDVPYVFLTGDDRIFYSASKTPGGLPKIYAADLKGNVKLIVDKGMAPTGTLK